MRFGVSSSGALAGGHLGDKRVGFVEGGRRFGCAVLRLEPRRPNLVHRFTQVFDHEVAICSQGRAYILMAKNSLNTVRIYSRTQEKGSRRMPQVVEAHRAVDRLNPQLHSASR